jgi:predicted transcriptional regulator
MTETLSLRTDAAGIAACVESEEWRIGEIQAGIAELESGQEVGHDKVSKWLKSWGKPSETRSPR